MAKCQTAFQVTFADIWEKVEWPSAILNDVFVSFHGERDVMSEEIVALLRASLQKPWISFAEVWT